MTGKIGMHWKKPKKPATKSVSTKLSETELIAFKKYCKKKNSTMSKIIHDKLFKGKDHV
jgi:hypothetical protein